MLEKTDFIICHITKIVFKYVILSEPRSEVDKAVLVMAREAAEEITTPRHIPG